jgi:hypothetical protein
VKTAQIVQFSLFFIKKCLTTALKCGIIAAGTLLAAPVPKIFPHVNPNFSYAISAWLFEIAFSRNWRY